MCVCDRACNNYHHVNKDASPACASLMLAERLLSKRVDNVQREATDRPHDENDDVMM